MPSSIINSDDGLISGTSGIKTTGGDDGSLKIQANGVDAISIASNGDVVVSGDLTVDGTIVGGGDVTGPASSTDNAIALFDGTTGKILKNGVVYTNANTASTVVQRDASGNFSAGAVSATGITFTGTQIITSGSASTYGATSIRGVKGGWTGISFYDSSNVFANTLMARSSDGYGGVYNKADNNWLVQWDGSGNFTATANVTAYSDERLKKDWAALPSDFIERLSKAKSGTYTRIDSDARQAGSSAQEWREILPEVVSEDTNGTLTLAYGNAALVSVIELSKLVLALKAEVDELKRSK